MKGALLVPFTAMVVSTADICAAAFSMACFDTLIFVPDAVENSDKEAAAGITSDVISCRDRFPVTLGVLNAEAKADDDDDNDDDDDDDDNDADAMDGVTAVWRGALKVLLLARRSNAVPLFSPVAAGVAEAASARRAAPRASASLETCIAFPPPVENSESDVDADVKGAGGNRAGAGV